jgi:arylsulfatase A-like enzyme
MEHPNILFILTDQQRFDTCGCYGQKLNVTPNLDKLAKEGSCFRHAFTNQPVCGPARSILQTGNYATETGCYRNGIALPKSNQNIAQFLSQQGYEVAYIGKWHLASTIGRSKERRLQKMDHMTSAIPSELRGGYKDYWLASDLLEFTSHSYEGHLFDKEGNRQEFEGYRVDCLTDFALTYLDSRTRNSPFFLFLSYLEPHQQNDHNAFEGPEGSTKIFGNYEVPGDLKGTEGDWSQFFPDYLGCCNAIDKNLGRLLQKLRQLGEYENTTIIFSSDHGCHFRTRNQEYKRSCHESSIRIPLVIKGKNFQGGKIVEDLVSLIDLVPTILKISDTDIPKSMRGNPLHDLIENDSLTNNWKKNVFIQISESQVGRAIRTKKWKYSVKAPKRDGILYSKSDVYEGEFFYDLENDPFEKHNLIKDSNYIVVKKELSQLLIKRMVEAGEAIPRMIV